MLAVLKTRVVLGAAGGLVALVGTTRPALSSIGFLRLASNILIQRGGKMLALGAIVAKHRSAPWRSQGDTGAEARCQGCCC